MRFADEAAAPGLLDSGEESPVPQGAAGAGAGAAVGVAAASAVAPPSSSPAQARTVRFADDTEAAPSTSAAPRQMGRVASDAEVALRLGRWREHRAAFLARLATHNPRPRVVVFSSLQLDHGSALDRDVHLNFLKEALLLLESRLMGRPVSNREAEHSTHELFHELRGTAKGKGSAMQRTAAVDAFRRDDGGDILLLDAANSDGWDLGFATHVFVMEPLFDASIQEQAVSRVHRLSAAHNAVGSDVNASAAERPPPVVVEVLAIKDSLDEFAPGMPSHYARADAPLRRGGVDVVLPSTHTAEDVAMCHALLNLRRVEAQS